MNKIRAIIEKHKDSMPVVAVAELLAEIEETCEWKRPKDYDNCMAEHNCEVFFIEHYMVKQFNYCPFCGKSIKILEVADETDI